MIDYQTILEAKEIHVIFECNPEKIREIRRTLLELGVNIDDIRIEKLDSTRCKLSVEQEDTRASKTDLVRTQQGTMAAHNAATRFGDVLNADSSPWIGLVGDSDSLWLYLPNQDPQKLSRSFLDDLGYDDMVFTETLADCLWGMNYFDAVELYDIACDQLAQAKATEEGIEDARTDLQCFVATFQAVCGQNPSSIDALVDLLEQLSLTNAIASIYQDLSLKGLKPKDAPEAQTEATKKEEEKNPLSHSLTS